MPRVLTPTNPVSCHAGSRVLRALDCVIISIAIFSITQSTPFAASNAALQEQENESNLVRGCVCVCTRSARQFAKLVCIELALDANSQSSHRHRRRRRCGDRFNYRTNHSRLGGGEEPTLDGRYKNTQSRACFVGQAVKRRTLITPARCF